MLFDSLRRIRATNMAATERAIATAAGATPVSPEPAIRQPVKTPAEKHTETGTSGRKNISFLGGIAGEPT
jgi:hypothetical protein